MSLPLRRRLVAIVSAGEPITHRLKLDDIGQGFERMERGQSIRFVVVC